MNTDKKKSVWGKNKKKRFVIENEKKKCVIEFSLNGIEFVLIILCVG